MHLPDLTELAAAAATALAVAGAFPQTLRLARTSDTAGVSLAGATLGVVTESGWIAYTLQGRLWSAVAEPALMVAANLILAGAIVRAGFDPARSVGVGVSWAVVLVAMLVAGGWTALGFALALAYAVQVTPSICAAYRTPTPSGIAPARWAITLLECLLWGLYGLDRDDAAIALFAMLGSAASAAILIRWRATRHRFPSPNPFANRLRAGCGSRR